MVMTAHSFSPFSAANVADCAQKFVNYFEVPNWGVRT